MIQKPRKIPTVSGIYIFRAKNGIPLYIGKAANLKTRLAFYFRAKPSDTQKAAKLVQEATKISVIKTDSAIEALVKEAALIKRYRPKYNILMRDDKNYLFVIVTNDAFPKIILTHQPQKNQNSKIIGPFTDAASLKTVLGLLRKAFPYCTCMKPHKKPCLNAELGKCRGFCCYEQNPQPATSDHRQEYARNIRAIISILEGKRSSLLLKQLKKDFKKATTSLEYEKAAEIRDRLFSLQQVLNHREIVSESRYLDKNKWPELGKKIAALVQCAGIPQRIEGYDISNVSGISATGSMVVFINGIPQKSEYRKFKIKTVQGPNDVAMLSEVIARRLKHGEWETPDLMVIDGGKPQLNAALAVLQNPDEKHYERLRHQSQSNRHKSPIAIAALAKHDEELYMQNRRYPIQLKKQPAEILHFFQRIRDEAHRFAKKYHHKLRQRELYEK